jgi:pimeloyl-ACP methyl ester carboxylesterase
MTRATASPKVDRTIKLRDGRAMAYSEWGKLDGRPIVLTHGTPGSRLFCPDEDATASAGVRLITIDRPGYGRSDLGPSRALVEWADDFVELTDILDLQPCPVIGWSGGGPYAMAVALRVPDRVPTIGLAASPGPTALVPGGTDAYTPDDRAAFELLARDPVAGTAAIRDLCAWYTADGSGVMFEESLGAADDRVLAEPGVLEAVREWMAEGARQGSFGFADDWVAIELPWGFPVQDITQQVHLWWGESDLQVSRAHTDYLAASIPGASLVTFESEGHLFPITHWSEMLDVLR